MQYTLKDAYIAPCYGSFMRNRAYFTFVLLVFSSLPNALSAEQVWHLNDVTYVFPLPNQALLPVSIRSTDRDADGASLLPSERFLRDTDKYGRFIYLMPGNILPRSPAFDPYYDMFVVSVRIDPCFKDRFSDSCRRQVRVVWQPVDDWRTNAPESIDVAVHTFYDLTKTQFTQLTRSLLELKRRHAIRTTGLPLGIHPGFSTSAPTDFQRDFKKLILAYIPAKKIRRLATMRMTSFGLGWDLFSVDFVEGERFPIEVPIFPGRNTSQFLENRADVLSLKDDDTGADPEVLKKISQELSTRKIHTSAYRNFRSSIDLPEKDVGDQILEILPRSSDALAAPGRAKDFFIKANRIENPSKHLPATIDCASCHIANAVKLIAQKASGLPLELPKFKGRYDLKNNSYYYGDTHQLRMLGYLYEHVQIGDRTIFESAAVADKLNQTATPR